MSVQNIGEEKTWVPTRREQEIGENDASKITKVVYEKKKRQVFGSEVQDVLDIVVKTVGIVAIFIPLLLLLIQRHLTINNENRKEKALLFGQIVKSYAKVFQHQNNTFESLSAIDSVDFLLTSQLGIADKKNNLFDKVNYLNNNLAVYANMNKNIALLDSLGKLSMAAIPAVSQISKTEYSDRHLKDVPGFGAYKSFMAGFENFEISYIEAKEDKVSISGNYKELDSIKTEIDRILTAGYYKLNQIYLRLNEVGVLKNESEIAREVFFRPRYTEDLNAVKMDEKDSNDTSFFSQVKKSKALSSKYFDELKRNFAEIKNQMQQDLDK